VGTLSGWMAGGLLLAVSVALVVLGFAAAAWLTQPASDDADRSLTEAVAPTEAPGAPTAPDAAPAPPPPVRVKVVRDAPAPPEPVAPTPEAPALPPRLPVGEIPEDRVVDRVVGEGATLWVDARQPAEVYIAGQYVAPAPVKRELAPGRYAVSLVALDGRRRTFEVDLKEGDKVRRTWDFDRGAWR
jgi:type IV secretory pathway VirB10-like protein